MAIYVVSYDVASDNRRDAIVERLEALESEDKAVRVQQSVWLLRSKSTIGKVAGHFRQYLDDEEDSLLVTKVRGREDIAIWGNGGANLRATIEFFLDDGGF